MKRVSINIDNFLGGFTPAWYNESYPSYGNNNMAGDMRNVEITPSYLSPAYGLTDYPGFASAGVQARVKAICPDNIDDGGYTFAACQDYASGMVAFKISTASAHCGSISTATASAPVYIQDTCSYVMSSGSKAGFVSWYNSASANIGTFIDSTTDFDEDFLTSYASGSISASVPLPMDSANGYLYVGNGDRVSTLSIPEGTWVWAGRDLSLPLSAVVKDLKWCNDRLYVAYNMPNYTGTATATIKSNIAIWDGTSDAKESEIKCNGNISRLFVDNSIVYVFYQDGGNYKMGYISGLQVKEICTYTGGLPGFSQVIKHNGFIKWVAGSYVWAYGSPDINKISPFLIQCNDGGFSNMSAIANPFGTLVVSSYTEGNTTDYKLAKVSTSAYETDSYWKSRMFPVGKCTIDELIVYFDPLTEGARADFTLTCDNGNIVNTAGLTLNETGIAKKIFNVGQRIENNFRIEVNHSNGSASYPVKINRMEAVLSVDNI